MHIRGRARRSHETKMASTYDSRFRIRRALRKGPDDGVWCTSPIRFGSGSMPSGLRA